MSVVPLLPPLLPHVDADGLADLSRVLRSRAGEIRARTASLEAAAAEVAWEGRSAEALRAAISTLATLLDATAVLHERAADAVGAQADAVAARSGLVGAGLDALGRLL